MSHPASAILFACLAWFLSTGAVLWLVSRPRRDHAWVMIAVSAMLGASVVGLVAVGGQSSVSGAFIGFTLGLGVWAWHETAFLLGYVTGPRTTPCPPGARGWDRFVAASETVIFHELAIAATAILLTMITWRAPNQIGVWTFLLLWGMRLSAKFNLYAGAPHLNEEFLPAHHAHLPSYFGPKRTSAFFYVSLLAISAVAALLVAGAIAAVDAFAATAFALLATLASLAVVEHLFMILPVRDAALWAWARPAVAASRTTGVRLQTPPRAAKPGGGE